MRLCSFPNCARKHNAMGYCRTHRAQQQRGRPLTPLRRYCDQRGICRGTFNAGLCRECDTVVWRDELCVGHWTGEKPRRPPTWHPWPTERLLHARTADADQNGCKLWLGAPYGKYGGIPVDGTTFAVHRVAYEVATRTKISSAVVIHHTCANKMCVNPDHLQAVKPHENLAEMMERRFYNERIARLEAENRSLKLRNSDLEYALKCHQGS